MLSFPLARKAPERQSEPLLPAGLPRLRHGFSHHPEKPPALPTRLGGLLRSSLLSEKVLVTDQRRSHRSQLRWLTAQDPPASHPQTHSKTRVRNALRHCQTGILRGISELWAGPVGTWERVTGAWGGWRRGWSQEERFLLLSPLLDPIGTAAEEEGEIPGNRGSGQVQSWWGGVGRARGAQGAEFARDSLQF